MSVLKIEFDTNDTVTLNAITKALVSIYELKAEAPAPVAEAPAPVAPAPVAEAPAPVAEAPAPVAEAPAPVAEAPVAEAHDIGENPVGLNPALDAAGMPWDERIHSRTQTQDARGVWKLQRKPKRFGSVAEWETFVEACRAQNRGLGKSIIEPEKVVTGYVEPSPAPAPAAPSGVVEGAPSVFNDTPPAPTPAPTPAPVAEAPVVEAPAPVVEAPAPITFAELMRFVTMNKIDVSEVTAIVQKHGVDKLPLLAQRPDLFRVVIEELKALVK